LAAAEQSFRAPCSVSGSYAQPAGATGNYLATGFTRVNGTVSEEVGLTGQHNYLGLYWGSIDSYNTINLFNGSTLVGTIMGNQVGAPANGDQASGDANRYVNILCDQLFDRVEFVTTSPAFCFAPEVANVGNRGFERRPRFHNAPLHESEEAA
jgi:hypothetical protein